jgi:hypothetical protein
MPEISRFFGIVISMYFDEHNPPHFHAYYGKENVVIEIASLRISDGVIPSRALGLIIEWAYKHQEELMHNWELAKNGKPVLKIEPLG